MTQIIVYSTGVCPYCDKAKDLLKRKGLAYQEMRVDTDQAKREEMLQKTNNARTVPQIFIGETHVGGYTDLYELEQAGKLDELVS